MNQALLLSTTFLREDRKHGPVIASFPKNGTLRSSQIQNLIESVKKVQDYWKNNRLPDDQVLVSVRQNSVIAKSHRISKLIAKADIKIRGAKFIYDETDKRKHLFTYLISRADLDELKNRLEEVRGILNKYFDGIFTLDHFEKLKNKKYNYKIEELSRTALLGFVAEIFYIDEFTVPTANGLIEKSGDENVLVSFFDIGDKLEEFLKEHQLEFSFENRWDKNTYLVNRAQARIIREKIPYLVSMEITDIHSLTSLPDSHEYSAGHGVLTIKDPTNEPVVGVFDTHFCSDLYFSKWVEYHNETPKRPLSENDYIHGTAVTGLIVDGPKFNPQLDDGCGNFRVRHFGVATNGANSVLSLMKKIDDIVRSNPDIKVWNLSLGSEMEIEEFSISPGAALIDKLQKECDVIFVIAATNMPKGKKAPYKIGAPADSLCSLVVGSVNDKGEPFSGSREGPVLTFYYKPDIAARGGEMRNPKNRKETQLVLPSKNGARYSYGTSYAAPWITRKLAYLIHTMKLSKEAAKALLIDAAAGWGKTNQWADKIGFGEVPIRIEDVINSKDDEIKFIVEGVSTNFITSTEALPVPLSDNKFPFKARATLCYFPRSERSHGVDYTLDELQIKLGPMKKECKKNAEGKIVEERTIISPLNNDYQYEKGHATSEDEARTNFRKWDNIKHLSEKITNYSKANFNDHWGIQVKAIKRGSDYEKNPIAFALVVVLKEVKGVNRIKQFINLCERSNQWTVRPLDIQQSVIIRQKAQEELFP